MLQRLAWIAGLLLLAPLASAHTMNPTLVLVSFAQSGSVDVKIDADLTLLLGSPERYYAFASCSCTSGRSDCGRCSSNSPWHGH
jgi:hypothetical protein